MTLFGSWVTVSGRTLSLWSSGWSFFGEVEGGCWLLHSDRWKNIYGKRRVTLLEEHTYTILGVTLCYCWGHGVSDSCWPWATEGYHLLDGHSPIHRETRRLCFVHRADGTNTPPHWGCVGISLLYTLKSYQKVSPLDWGCPLRLTFGGFLLTQMVTATDRHGSG